MFRWLRERRRRRDEEARKALASLSKKPRRRPAEPPLASLLPDEPFRDGVAEEFATRLIAQAEANPGSHSHSFSVGGNYAHTVPVSIGSHSHTASHDSGSHSHSYDSSSGSSGSSDW